MNKCSLLLSCAPYHSSPHLHSPPVLTCQGLSPPWKPALQGSPKDLIGAQGGRGQGEFPIVYEPAQSASWEQDPVQLQPQGGQE